MHGRVGELLAKRSTQHALDKEMLRASWSVRQFLALLCVGSTGRTLRADGRSASPSSPAAMRKRRPLRRWRS